MHDVEKQKETDKAYQLRVKGAEFADGTDTAWFPKSACKLSDDENSADIDEWIIERKVQGDPGSRQTPIAVNNAVVMEDAGGGTKAVVDAIRDAVGDVLVALEAIATRFEKFFRDGGEEE